MWYVCVFGVEDFVRWLTPVDIPQAILHRTRIALILTRESFDPR